MSRSTIDYMRKSATRRLAGLSFVLFAACGGSGGDDSAESPQTPAPPPPPPAVVDVTATSVRPTAPFVDVTAASNIGYRVGYTRPYLVRGKRAVSDATIGGAAAGDCDNDGDIDLFVTYGNTSGRDGGGGPNRLYMNQLAEQGNGLLFESAL